MIKIKKEGQLVAEFGSGDICVSGAFKALCEPNEGCLVLSNQEKQEVGTLTNKKTFDPENEVYIKLIFKSVDSLDVLLNQLLLTRQEMLVDGTNKMSVK